MELESSADISNFHELSDYTEFPFPNKYIKSLNNHFYYISSPNVTKRLELRESEVSLW